MMLMHVTGGGDWWRRRRQELPHWCTAFMFVLFIQASSAAAKEFSLLQNPFTQQQSSPLEDSIATIINHNWSYSIFDGNNETIINRSIWGEISNSRKIE